MNKLIGYIRVSTDTQDLKNQRHEILEYAHRNKLTVNEFIEIEVSSRKTPKERRINELLEKLSSGDTLIVCELSRLGRSLGEIVSLWKIFIDNKIKFISIKENLSNTDNMSKYIAYLIGIFAELERDLISQRTKHALAARKAQGVILGRPKGKLGFSKLAGRKEEIQNLLNVGVSQVRIAKTCGVSRGTLIAFINTRNLQKPF